MFDFCVIGAGPAGMTAAIAAARACDGLQILILEKKEAPGRKLLATGNGRCNLTNLACPGAEESLAFFRSLGLTVRCEAEGRVYPHSERAGDVLRALLLELDARGAAIRAGAAATAVKRLACGAFRVVCEDKSAVEARRLLIAAGGKAGPQYGCTGDGFGFARSLGHRVTRTAPALAAVECSGPFRELAGVRAKVRAQLLYRGKPAAEEPGEVQFTEKGLSGICIFNLSRLIRLAAGKSVADGFAEYEILLDFFPEMEEAELRAALGGRLKRGIPPEYLLFSIVHEKLAAEILREARLSCGTGEAGGLAAAAAALIKGWRVPVAGVAGWKTAQCTAGGVELAELDADTMESKLVPGLYFAGEILDRDGPCGGYNLQNAWETGLKAGAAAGIALAATRDRR